LTYATRVLAAISLTGLSVIAAAQCGSVDRDSPDAVREEVNRNFNHTLDAMEDTLPSGVKVATWMPPDDSVRSQIKCLGTAAVPATAELLRNTRRSFGHILAIRMLGWEGGPDIVPPLADVLAKPGNPLKLDSLKLEALESLSYAPPDKALPVIQNVLRSEKNSDLLKNAESVAARLKSEVDN
jgi:hypothetical protein